MCDEDCIDIVQQLDELLSNVQPNLQDVIKRSFTNVVLQQSRNGEQVKADTLEDTSYFAKNTQVNLSRLELIKSPTFHVQSLSLDVKSMSLSLRCSLGEVSLKGVYSAFNENLYNLLPVMSEGHFLISLANMMADVNVGLVLEDDTYSFINPGINFTHDEVVIKLSWPSPNKKTSGYDFTTTEQLAKHIDDLPLSAAVSLPLFALLRRKLTQHLRLVLRQAASVSEVMCCNPSLMETYSEMVNNLSRNGNKVIDMLLINTRRMLLQNRHEVLQVAPLHATFLHKIGSISFVGRFETDVGWVKNLATVNRTHDVSIVRIDPLTTRFRVNLSVKDLQVGYNEYRMTAMGVCCGGRVAAGFATSAVHMAVAVGAAGVGGAGGAAGAARWEPYAQLEDLSVQDLDGMDLHVTGLGPLSGTSPLVGAWVRGGGVAAALQQQLQNEVRAALAHTPLWDLMQQNN